MTTKLSVTTKLPAFLRGNLEPPPADSKTGYKLIRDPDTRGLYLRITKAGAKSWVHIRARSFTIGSYDDWSYRQARDRARELNRLMDEGKDPFAEREARRTAPTVSELIELWRDDVNSKVPPKLRRGTVKEYEGIIRQWIMPHLGKKRVTDVTKDDIEKLHRKITVDGSNRATPSRANRTLALVSALFGFAMKKGLRTDNPARGVERNREEARSRMLTGGEFERLLAAITECRYPQAQRALRLVTGARRNEVLGMRWADIDLTAGTWHKPSSLTKQKRVHIVPLSAPARSILSDIHREQLDLAARYDRPMPTWVFPGSGKRGEHVREVKTSWHNVCRRAGIEDLHLHDLRHVFATFFASTGTGLPLIGRLLGHNQARTTERYSHVHLDPLREQVERFGSFIEAVEQGRVSGEVKQLPRTRRRVG